MAKPKKTWREKLLDDKDLPKRIELSGAAAQKFGAGTMVVPAPREIDALMRQVPKGKLTTLNDIRDVLAETHGTSTCCPLTTGIFSWIAAHAAEEDRDRGAKRVTAYWRTLKSGGELNPKYPGGISRVRELLEAEGHAVVAKGKRFFVRDWERRRHRLAAADERRPSA